MQTSIQGAKINSLPLDYGRLSYSILTEVILLVYLLAIKGIGKKKKIFQHAHIAFGVKFILILNTNMLSKDFRGTKPIQNTHK